MNNILNSTCVKKLLSSIFVLLILSNPLLAEETKFKVGILIPLSGIVSDYGRAIQNGFEMALNDHSNFRDKISYIYEDTKYNNNSTISAFNKLKDLDRVDLIYVFGTNASTIIAPLAERVHMPMIALSGEPNVAAGRTYVIDFHNRLEKISLEMLRYLRTKGLKKLGVVKTEVQYLESLLKGFEPYLAHEKITVIDSFKPDEVPDFNTVALRIKKGVSDGKYDAIGTFLLPGQFSNLYKKLHTYKINVFTFSCDVMGQDEETKRSLPAVVGGIYGILGVEQSFVSKYESKYGDRLQIEYAANAFDLSSLIIEKFGGDRTNLNPEQIISKFQDNTSRQGASGIFKYQNESDLNLESAGKRYNFPIVIKQVQEDGTAKELSRKDP